ncbi:MAG: hypothetical protein Q9197_001130 [Variospora fuerteventurae]
MSSSSLELHDKRFATGTAQPLKKPDNFEAVLTPDETVDVKGNDPWKMMQLVKSLPSEVSNQVMENLWEEAFYPGYVYLPTRINGEVPSDYEKDSFAARPTLLSLSRGIHADFQRRFWRENTFVIGAGQPVAEEDELQLWLPEAATNHITKVYISFTVRDLGEDLASSLPSGLPNWRPCPTPSPGEWDHQSFGWCPGFDEALDELEDNSTTNASHSSWDHSQSERNETAPACMISALYSVGLTSMKFHTQRATPCLNGVLPFFYPTGHWLPSWTQSLSRQQPPLEPTDAGPTVTINTSTTNTRLTWQPSPLPSFPTAEEDPSPSEEERHQRHHEALTLELHKLWINKKWALYGLPALAEVTLDFFECYSTDGRWIGDEVAVTVPRLGKGVSVDVVAPDEAKRQLVESLIREKMEES